MPEACMYLVDYLGHESPEEILAHLDHCAECAQDLHDWHEAYQRKEIPTGASETGILGRGITQLPKGLDKKEFLRHWSLTVAKNSEDKEFRQEQLIAKLVTPECLGALRKLFWVQKIALDAIKLDIQHINREERIASLTHRYRELERLLGTRELEFLLFDGTVEEILMGWEHILSS